jgi:murein DD-endopeptidase MepM/ murein hydrolase activator NlpD
MRTQQRVRDRLEQLWTQARPRVRNGVSGLSRFASGVGGVLSKVFGWTLAQFRRVHWDSIKPGWYVIIIGTLYALMVTLLLIGARGQLNAAQQRLKALEAKLAPSSALAWPVLGAGIPKSDDNLPNAPRTYRKGVSQGFTFQDTDAGVPIAFGTPVVAAGDGQIVRADLDYKELASRDYLKLLEAVKSGASENDLNLLRGRQVWIKHPNGTITRYGHLSRIAPGLRFGSIRRGAVIGFVGNSGTLEGVRGGAGNARLQFEIWSDKTFFGAGLKPADLRAQVAKLIQR